MNGYKMRSYKGKNVYCLDGKCYDVKPIPPLEDYKIDNILSEIKTKKNVKSIRRSPVKLRTSIRKSIHDRKKSRLIDKNISNKRLSQTMVLINKPYRSRVKPVKRTSRRISRKISRKSPSRTRKRSRRISRRTSRRISRKRSRRISRRISRKR